MTTPCSSCGVPLSRHVDQGVLCGRTIEARATIAGLRSQLAAARRGDAICIDDDGTPFAPARAWRTANSEACKRLEESRNEADELRAERDRLNQDVVILRAIAWRLLDGFTESAHLGKPCVRSGWIDESVIDELKAALAAPETP